ncbi:probable G-protein coupled receptor Mth-like 11 isoform X1 [Metopolophium dirhodum]|uniref:probable G-protein coupled receptor Mth-like 11 isoform X1 n=1 Tax=Metopolophium dirhodum TaxID=44670 RepID=UPI00298FF34D|nr:probable G-protein coupled receptor Mth-like 11 isoform X1 [Metopolophium dirhodum]
MNTVRSYFAVTVAFLMVAIGWWAADAVVCCNSTSTEMFCRNKNRTFNIIETINGEPCDDNLTAVPVWKCFPPFYSKWQKFGPAGVDGDERMMQRLKDGFRAVTDAVMVGYYNEELYCDDSQVLVDVPAMEVRRLMEADPSAVELPPGYCFNLTPSDELVAQTCRPRKQHCGQDDYTCVNKCCNRDQMYVDDYYDCMLESEKPFTMSAYETDAEGHPVGRSNSTVQPYYTYVNLPCINKRKFKFNIMLEIDNITYVTKYEDLAPDTKYCVDYSPVDYKILPILCPSDYRSGKSYGVLPLFANVQCFNKKILKEGFILTTDGILYLSEKSRFQNLMADICNKYAEGSISSRHYFLILSGYVTSVVCLALTLLVYATLPSLRNVHGYYVMCYIACLLVLYVCRTIDMMAFDNLYEPVRLPFDYFTLFAYLTTFCWLNVICFDIYWKMRYNNLRKINTSTSVRTIMYHIYCWGFSSICPSIGYLYLLQLSNEKEWTLGAPKSYTSCWFSDCRTTGNLIFIIICVSMMLTANLILFLLTAIHCSRIKSELNKFIPTNSKTKSFLVNKEIFVMNIKLFLIMGIPWSFEIISIFFQYKWSILEFCNAIKRLQGVFIFIILVAKGKVIMDLREKFKRSMDYSEVTQINIIPGSS